MNLKEIKELLGLMKEHDLAEIEIEKDGLKLKLKKNGGTAVLEHSGEMSPMVIPIPRGIERPSAGSDAPKVAPVAENLNVVKSPMVGTFYAAPAPDQPVYASVGQSIKKGDVLCIIEAMKLMNEIKSEVQGTIVEVLVSNGQAVEFDQPLFKIKP